MPTLYEMQQQKQAAQEQKDKQLIDLGMSVGQMLTNVKGSTEMPSVSDIVSLVGNAAIGVVSMISGNKAASAEAKKQKVVSASQETLDKALSIFDFAGSSLVEQGYTPNTKEFDDLLVKVLKDLRYLGNNNLEILEPESPDQKSQRLVLFRIMNGKVQDLKPNIWLPANADSYWTVQSSNLRSKWIIQYNNKKIKEQRDAVLLKESSILGAKSSRATILIIIVVIILLILKFGI